MLMQLPPLGDSDGSPSWTSTALSMLGAMRRASETAAGINGRRKPTAKNTRSGLIECALSVQQFLHAARGCEHGNILTGAMPSFLNLCFLVLEHDILREAVASVFLNMLSEHVLSVPLYCSALPQDRMNLLLQQLVQSGLAVEADEGTLPPQFYAASLRAATALVLGVDTRGAAVESTAHHVHHSALWQDMPEPGYAPRTPAALPAYACFPLQAMPVLRASARWLATAAASDEWRHADAAASTFRKAFSTCRMKLACVREVMHLWGGFLRVRGAAAIPLVKLCGKQCIVAIVRGNLLQHVLDDPKCTTALLELLSEWLAASHAHAVYSGQVQPLHEGGQGVQNLALSLQDPLVEQLFYLCKRVLAHASCAHRVLQTVQPPPGFSGTGAGATRNKHTAAQQGRPMQQQPALYGCPADLGLPKAAHGLAALVCSASVFRGGAVEATAASFVLPHAAPVHASGALSKRRRTSSSSAAPVASSAPPPEQGRASHGEAAQAGLASPLQVQCPLLALAQAATTKLSNLAGRSVSAGFSLPASGQGGVALGTPPSLQSSSSSANDSGSVLPYALQTGEVALSAAETCTLLALALQLRGGGGGGGLTADVLLQLQAACVYVLLAARQLPSTVLLAVVHLVSAVRVASKSLPGEMQAALQEAAATSEQAGGDLVGNLSVRATAGDGGKMRALVRSQGGALLRSARSASRSAQGQAGVLATQKALEASWATIARVLRAALLPHVSSQRDAASQHALGLGLRVYADVVGDSHSADTAVSLVLGLSQARTDLGTGQVFLVVLECLDRVLFLARPAPAPQSTALPPAVWGTEGDDLLATGHSLLHLTQQTKLRKPGPLGAEHSALHEVGGGLSFDAAKLHWREGALVWAAARLAAGFASISSARSASDCAQSALVAAETILHTISPQIAAHAAHLSGAGGVLDGVAGAASDLSLSAWLTPQQADALHCCAPLPGLAQVRLELDDVADPNLPESLLHSACPAMWTHASGLVAPRSGEFSEQQSAQQPVHDAQHSLRVASLLVATVSRLTRASLAPFWGRTAVPKPHDVRAAAAAMRFACRVLPAIHVLAGSRRSDSAANTPDSLTGRHLLACAVAATSCLMAHVACSLQLLKTADERHGFTRAGVLADCRAAMFHLHQWQAGQLLQVIGAAAPHPMGVLGGGLPACIVRECLALVRAAYLCDIHGLAPSVSSAGLSKELHQRHCRRTQERHETLHKQADDMLSAAKHAQPADDVGSRPASQHRARTQYEADEDADFNLAVPGSSGAGVGDGQAHCSPPQSACFVRACDMLCLGHMMMLPRGGVVDPVAADAVRNRWEVPLAAAAAASAEGGMLQQTTRDIAVAAVDIPPDSVLLPSWHDGEIASSGFVATGTASLTDVALDAVARNPQVHPCDVAAVSAAVSAAALGHQLLTEHWARRATGSTVAAAAVLLDLTAPQGLGQLHSTVLALSAIVSLRSKATHSSFLRKFSVGAFACSTADIGLRLALRAERYSPAAPPAAAAQPTQDAASQDSDLDISIVDVKGVPPTSSGTWLLSLDSACTAAHNRFRPNHAGHAPAESTSLLPPCIMHVKALGHADMTVVAESDAAASCASSAETLRGLACGHQGQWLSAWRASAVLSQCDLRVASSVRADRAFVPLVHGDSLAAKEQQVVTTPQPSPVREAQGGETPESVVQRYSRMATSAVAFTAVVLEGLRCMLGHWHVMASCVLSYEQGQRRYPDQELATRVNCALATHVQVPLTRHWGSLGILDRCEGLMGGLQRAPTEKVLAFPATSTGAAELPKGLLGMWEAVMDMGNGPEEVWSFCGVSEVHQPGCVDEAHGEHSLYAICFAALSRCRLHTALHPASTRIAAAGLLKDLILELPRVAHSRELWQYNVQDGLALGHAHAQLMGAAPTPDVTALETAEDNTSAQACWIAHWVLLALVSPSVATAAAALPAFRALRTLRQVAPVEPWCKRAPPMHTWPLIRPRIEQNQLLNSGATQSAVQDELVKALLQESAKQAEGNDTAAGMETSVKLLCAGHGVAVRRSSGDGSSSVDAGSVAYCCSLVGCAPVGLCGAAVGSSPADNGPTFKRADLLVSPSRAKKVAPGFVETDGALALTLCSAAMAIAGSAPPMLRPGKLSDGYLHAICLLPHSVVGPCIEAQLAHLSRDNGGLSALLRQHATSIFATYMLSTGCGLGNIPAVLLQCTSWSHMVGAFMVDMAHAAVLCAGAAALAKAAGRTSAQLWQGPLLLSELLFHYKSGAELGSGEQMSAATVLNSAVLSALASQQSHPAAVSIDKAAFEGCLAVQQKESPARVDTSGAFQSLLGAFKTQVAVFGRAVLSEGAVLAGLAQVTAAFNTSGENDPWQAARVSCAQAVVQACHADDFHAAVVQISEAVLPQLAGMVVWGKSSRKESQQMLAGAVNSVLFNMAQACSQDVPAAATPLTTFQFLASVNTAQGKLVAQMLMHSADPCPVFNPTKAATSPLMAMASLYTQARKRADVEVSDRANAQAVWPSMLVRLSAAEFGAWVSRAVYARDGQHSSMQLSLLQALHSSADFASVLEVWKAAAAGATPGSAAEAVRSMRQALENRPRPLLARINGMGVLCHSVYLGLHAVLLDAKRVLGGCASRAQKLQMCATAAAAVKSSRAAMQLACEECLLVALDVPLVQGSVAGAQPHDPDLTSCVALAMWFAPLCLLCTELTEVTLAHVLSAALVVAPHGDAVSAAAQNAGLGVSEESILRIADGTTSDALGLLQLALCHWPAAVASLAKVAVVSARSEGGTASMDAARLAGSKDSSVGAARLPSAVLVAVHAGLAQCARRTVAALTYDACFGGTCRGKGTSRARVALLQAVEHTELDWPEEVQSRRWRDEVTSWFWTSAQERMGDLQHLVRQDVPKGSVRTGGGAAGALRQTSLAADQPHTPQETQAFISSLGVVCAPGTMPVDQIQLDLKRKAASVVSKQAAQRVTSPAAGARGTPSLSPDGAVEGIVDAVLELQKGSALLVSIARNDEMQSLATGRQSDVACSVADAELVRLLGSTWGVQQHCLPGLDGTQRSLVIVRAGLLRAMQDTQRANGVGLSSIRDAVRRELWRLRPPELMQAQPMPRVEEARCMFSKADCAELLRDSAAALGGIAVGDIFSADLWQSAASDPSAMWHLLILLASTVLAGSPPAQLVFTAFTTHRDSVSPWSLLPLVILCTLHVSAVAACQAADQEEDTAAAGRKRRRRASSTDASGSSDSFTTAFSATGGLLADTGMHQVAFAQRAGDAVQHGFSPEDVAPSKLFERRADLQPSSGGADALQVGAEALGLPPPRSNIIRDGLSRAIEHMLLAATSTADSTGGHSAMQGVLQSVGRLRTARGSIMQWLLTFQGAQPAVRTPQWLQELGVADPHAYMHGLSLDVSYTVLLQAAGKCSDSPACALYSDLLLQHASARRQAAHSGLISPSAILSVMQSIEMPTRGTLSEILDAVSGAEHQSSSAQLSDLADWASLSRETSPSLESLRGGWDAASSRIACSDGLCAATDLGSSARLSALPPVQHAADAAARVCHQVGTREHLHRFYGLAMRARCAFDDQHSKASTQFSALDALLAETRTSADIIAKGCEDSSLELGSDATAYALASLGQAITLHGCLAPRSASGIEFGVAAAGTLPDAVRSFKREAVLRKDRDGAAQSMLHMGLQKHALYVQADDSVKPGEVASGAVGILQVALHFAKHGAVSEPAKAALNIALARAHSCVAQYTEEVVVSIQAHNSSEVGRMLAAAAASRAASYSPQMYQRALTAYKQGLSPESFRAALELDQPVRPQDYVQSLKRVGRQVAADEAAELARTSTYSLCLTAALYNSARSLSSSAAVGCMLQPLSYEQRLQLSFRFVGLWMNHFSRPEVVQVLSGVLDSIPVSDLLPLIPQLTSQLGCGLTGAPLLEPPSPPQPVTAPSKPLDLDACKQDQTYAAVIETLLMRMAFFAPYEVVPRLVFVSQYDFDCVTTLEVSSKRESALRVLGALRDASPDHADIVQVISETFEAYTAIAFQDHRNDKALKQLTSVSLSSVSMLHDRRAKVSGTFRPHRKTHATGVQWNRLLPVLTQGAESRGQLAGMRVTPALQWAPAPGGSAPPAVAADEGGMETLPGGTPLPEMWVQSTDEQYTTMGSGITKPKRLNHVGSDGGRYSIIFKGPNDDMRQDATMMQLFCVINAFLSCSGLERSKLKLRTYGVVPLSQRCGMVQMVQHTCAFNAAVVPLHVVAAMQGEMSVSDARRAIAKAANDDRPNQVARGGAAASTSASELPAHMYAKRLSTYNDVCSRLLPKFHFWFLQRYTNAAAWQAACSRFRHSLASSSIAGYIAGVGDRHTSNILLDMRSGELVHIDFGVVFDAGKLLPTPETIPFRLTRDLVDGLGALGVEGGMRQEAAATLAAIRANKRALCTVASVMVHDPLFSWTLVQTQEAEEHMAASTRGSVHGAAAYGQTERLNPDALSVVSRIEEKILGLDSDVFAPAIRPPPLYGVGGGRREESGTCDSHVRELIAAAVDEHRLCRLFAGWMAFL